MIAQTLFWTGMALGCGPLGWQVWRHGIDADLSQPVILSTGLGNALCGFSFWLQGYWPSAIFAGLLGFVLLWSWWRGGKGKRGQARKLIGDKFRQILAQMRETLRERTRERGRLRSPVPVPG